MKDSDELVKQKELIEKLKLYRKYLESKDSKIQQDIDDKIGINPYGENLLMKYNTMFKKTITYKQIKKGKCPKDFIERWLRVINGEPEFKKFKEVVPKNKSNKHIENNSFIKDIQKIIDNTFYTFKVDPTIAIYWSNKMISNVKIIEKIISFTKGDEKLIEKYILFINSINGSISMKKFKKKYVPYEELIEKKAKEMELDLEFCKFIIRSSSSYRARYSINKNKKIIY